MSIFKDSEDQVDGFAIDLDEAIGQIPFNDQGLIPAVVQDSSTLEVLMLAWVNEEAIRLSIQTQKATFYTRSRQKIWVKGEESGNEQIIESMALDCDGDALLMKVKQKGPGACHTLRKSCFFYQIKDNQLLIQSK